MNSRTSVEGAHETMMNPITEEPGGTKRPAVQETSACKKSKEQRSPHKYTITEDDGKMIARMVQDCLTEDFDHAMHHMDKLHKELVEMGQLLKKFGESQITSSSRGINPSSAWTTERMEVREHDSVLPKPHSTVYIKPSMIQMDEIVGQTPLKDLDQVQLFLTRMPTKTLY
jgi:hypothetical protein